MRQFWRDHNWRALWNRHPQLLAYALVVIVTLVGFWRIGAVQSEQHQQSQERFQVACQVINDNKDLVKALIDISITVSKANPTPGLTDAQRRQREAALAQYQALIAPKIRHVDCDRFAAHPEEYFTKGTK